MHQESIPRTRPWAISLPTVEISSLIKLQVYAVRGEIDKAFEWLQISLDHYDSGLLSLLIDPLMRGLRVDPRYKAMLEKVGLPVSL